MPSEDCEVRTKIVLVVHTFPTSSETFIVNKFSGLLECGGNIHIICNRIQSAEWKQFPQLEKQAGIRRRVHAPWREHPRWLVAALLPFALLQCFLVRPLTTLQYFLRGAQFLGFQIVRRFYFDKEFILLKPKLIHFEFGALAAGRIYLRELLDCKITVSFRGYDLNFVELEKMDYYREVWQKADGIHCLGEDLWQRAQKRGCPAQKKHVLIPPAIDTNFFKVCRRLYESEIGTPQRPLKILSVGRLEWKKGYEFALQAIRILKNKELHLEYRIVGEGSYLEAIAFCRHQLDLGQEVTLLGKKSQEEVKQEMEWADLLVHAAVSEGFCNAVLEAQAMNLPIVVTDADGLKENVEDGVTGVVVPRRNPEALAEQLLRLAGDSRLREEMGKKGRLRVLNFFRLEDQIAAFEKFYREIFHA